MPLVQAHVLPAQDPIPTAALAMQAQHPAIANFQLKAFLQFIPLVISQIHILGEYSEVLH